MSQQRSSRTYLNRDGAAIAMRFENGEAALLAGNIESAFKAVESGSDRDIAHQIMTHLASPPMKPMVQSVKMKI